MEQMKMAGLNTVEVDYEKGAYSEEAKEFRPAVWKDGDSFCALLGPDPQTGIFGCGDSLEDALRDWTHEYQHRLTEPADDDPVVDEIKDSIDKNDVW